MAARCALSGIGASSNDGIRQRLITSTSARDAIRAGRLAASIHSIVPAGPAPSAASTSVSAFSLNSWDGNSSVWTSDCLSVLGGSSVGVEICDRLGVVH